MRRMCFIRMFAGGGQEMPVQRMLAEAPSDGPVEAGGKKAEEGREDAEALRGAIGVALSLSQSHGAVNK